MDPILQFAEEREKLISVMGENEHLKGLSAKWMRSAVSLSYVFNYEWLGRPIIQFPQDMVALQEIVWKHKPDLIIEAGVAHGGSLILSASLLALLDYCEASQGDGNLNILKSGRKVVGLDIDIRSHNRNALDSHPLRHKIELLEGSSIDASIVEKVAEIASSYKNVMVILDSNHTHDHVLSELEAYGPMTSVGQYCVVLDTLIDDLPDEFFHDRPWAVGDNPKSAVKEFLSSRNDFQVDHAIDSKLQISSAPYGYLKRVS